MQHEEQQQVVEDLHGFLKDSVQYGLGNIERPMVDEVITNLVDHGLIGAAATLDQVMREENPDFKRLGELVLLIKSYPNFSKLPEEIQSSVHSKLFLPKGEGDGYETVLYSLGSDRNQYFFDTFYWDEAQKEIVTHREVNQRWLGSDIENSHIFAGWKLGARVNKNRSGYINFLEVKPEAEKFGSLDHVGTPSTLGELADKLKTNRKSNPFHTYEYGVVEGQCIIQDYKNTEFLFRDTENNCLPISSDERFTYFMLGIGTCTTSMFVVRIDNKSVDLYSLIDNDMLLDSHVVSKE